MTQSQQPTGQPMPVHFVRAERAKRPQPATGLQKAVLALCLPMAVLLPAWIFFGRWFLGAAGAVSLFVLITLCPLMFVLQTVVGLVTLARGRWVEPSAAGPFTSIFHAGYWVSAFILPLCVGDDDGVQGHPPIPSPLQRLGVPGDVSASLAFLTFGLACFFLVAALVAAIVELDRAR